MRHHVVTFEGINQKIILEHFYFKKNPYNISKEGCRETSFFFCL